MAKKRDIPPLDPGEILLEEFLVPLGISQYRLAKDISVPQRRISEIAQDEARYQCRYSAAPWTLLRHGAAVLVEPADPLRSSLWAWNIRPRIVRISSLRRSRSWLRCSTPGFSNDVFAPVRFPIFGTAMSALILGEVPSSALLSGGLLVILGLVLIERYEQ